MDLAPNFMIEQAGHALAASAEGVGLNHMAAFTLLLLPGAYVALDTETLAVLNPWRTLRVSTRPTVKICLHNIACKPTHNTH